jgi:LPXTG-motif cell wall-anchored protein
MKKYLIFVTTCLFSLTAFAKQFQNSYISFQLPPNWNCTVKGTEWVCNSSDKTQAKQAVIVLTAKVVGPNDNFAYYNQYLKTPKTPKNRDGTLATPSKVQHLKTVQIANHPWVDGLHLGSLLPNFYSRYLVTIKNKIAVIVVFNAKKDAYTQFSKAFFDAINSLRVTANFTGNSSEIKGANESLGVSIDDPDAMGEDGSGADGMDGGASGRGRKSNTWLYGVALILAGAGAYFLIKRKKKK